MVEFHVPMEDGTLATIRVPIEITSDDASRIATAVSVYVVGDVDDEDEE